MMATNCPEAVPNDPDFITYLLSPDLCDCFFLVGNKDVQPVKIGVVRKMLLAHSVVLRSDMLAKEINDKKVIPVEDTFPDTFRNFLRFVYGYDNTESLGFDETDNLLYVAVKYLVEPLKARVASRLMKLLTPDNICTLLNNPVCYTVLELDSAITHILQYETDKIFSSPQFTGLCPNALVKVVEQDAMNVAEIEVWRAVVRWAKHRTNSECGEALRNELEEPAKHVRVCTIDTNSFDKEVVTTGILTDREVTMVCLSRGKGEKQDLVSFSNRVDCRRTEGTPPARALSFGNISFNETYVFSELFVLTKQHAIELLPLNCMSKVCPRSVVPKSLTYESTCTITISRITDYSNNTSSEDRETIVVSQQVEYDKEFSVPFTREGKNIVLEANTKYKVSLSFSENVQTYYCPNAITCENEHMSVMTIKRHGDSYHHLPIRELRYRPLQ